jgi:hypothetical protein
MTRQDPFLPVVEPSNREQQQQQMFIRGEHAEREGRETEIESND